jgi:hypothetical protein
MSRARRGVVGLGVAAALSVLLLVLHGSGTQAQSASSELPARLFAPTSFWNTPLPARAPLSGDSAALAASLVKQMRAYKPWIATTQYSPTVYSVSADQPTVRVTLDHEPSPNDYALQRQLAEVPIPAGAHPGGGVDHRLVIWQPSTDTMWEFWRARYALLGAEPGWHAGWGGVMHSVSRSSGVYAWPFGASASGLPLIGGLITLDDMRRGSIDHALALGVPHVRSRTFVAPANRTDGRYYGPATIPMGTRFRLDPNLDVASLHLPRVVQMIALAAQRYGMFVRDGSGAVSFYAQDPTPTGSNPYPAWFDHKTPSWLLQSFPWRRLQVVAPKASAP